MRRGDYKGAEKGKECFDKLSMNGFIFNNFKLISVRPERRRRAPMRKLNSRRS
jgi:hypothetical protein